MGLALDSFDLALKLFERSYHPMSARALSRDRSSVLLFMLMIRKSYNLYHKQRVLPFLKMPGPVEIDETLISRKRWSPFGK